MNKFWKWMEEKYKYTDWYYNKEYHGWNCDEEGITKVFFTPQMLLGYKIEYCTYHNIDWMAGMKLGELWSIEKLDDKLTKQLEEVE